MRFRRIDGPVVLVFLSFPVVAALIAALISLSLDRGHPRLDCQNNLRQLGGLAKLRATDGRLEPIQGSGFFLQLIPDIPEEDLGVYLCPRDPEAEGRRGGDYCSYHGPDEELLARMRADGRQMGGDDLIIAGCPRHEGGVIVLYSSSKVGFIRWEDVEGSDGDPVPIGPDSPDPRFRHLVR